MTPLAQALVRESLGGSRHPEFRGIKASMFADMHCFDITEVAELVSDLGVRIRETGTSERTAFLPAPRTWLEVRRFTEREDRAGVWKDRVGVLLEGLGDGTCRATVFARIDGAYGGGWALTRPDSGGLRRFTIPLHAPDARAVRRAIITEAEAWGLLMPAQDIYAALAIINTPRLIGRKQHMPHRGLERELLRNSKVVGSFPLHVWTEVKLEATPTFRDESGVEHEAHLTGRKCLHFCRQHLRIRNGKLELVSAHWRGDAALGIKRSRYRVIPTAQAAAGEGRG